jgi:ABC-type amino acid transport substrate-binding protein
MHPWLRSVLFALSACALPAVGQELVVAVTSSSVPFAFINPQGELTGFNVDLGRAVCEQLQRPCRIEAMPFPQIIPTVSAGRADFGLGNVLKTAERERQVAFSVPIWRSTSSFVGAAGTRMRNPADAIREKTICVVEGGAQQVYLRTLGGPSPLLMPKATNQAVLESLQRDECSLALLPTMQALPFLQSPAGKPYAFVGTPMAGDGLGGTVHVVVRPDQPALLNGVNEAIQTLIRNGTHEKISRRYFPFSIL